jgi:superfamily I DNA/RNA helicase
MSLKLVVNAGPGTGKTYTATSLIGYLRSPNKAAFLKNKPHTEEQLAIWEYVDSILSEQDFKAQSARILYGAYNREAVEDVKSKLPQKVAAHTLHGAGYQVLLKSSGYIKLNDSRGISLVEKLTGQLFTKNPDRFKWLCALKYIEKLKDELLQPTEENLRLMASKYDSLLSFPIHSQLIPQINQILPLMKTLDRSVGIEYIDQVWLALFMCKEPMYDLAIIDECQDLSPSRLLLSLKLAKNIVFIGDEDQAINAFAGADPESYTKIRAQCNHEMTLKTVFRCPPNIVEKANQISPRARLKGIKTTPGKVEQAPLSSLPDLVNSRSHYPSKPDEIVPAFYKQHLVICRYNAPLVNAALKFLKAGVPAVILGKQLVNSLCYLVEKFKALDLEDLKNKLMDYEDRLAKDAPPHLQEVIYDKGDCIRLAIQQAESVTDVVPLIKKLFLPKKDTPHVTLCTIHKAKGRESEHVYILFPPVPSPRATTVSQKQQEKNLEFVAVTRTLNTLTYITEDL